MEVRKGYKQTEVGIIPEDWEVKPIGDFFSISVGRDLKKENYSTSQDDVFKYPVFSNTVSNEGFYGFYNFPEYNGESLTIVGRGVGLGTAFKRSGGFGAIGRLLVLFPKENVNAAFVSEYINHRVKIFTESGGIPQLTGISISKYRIPIPPTLAEQEAIAEALIDADALIEAVEQLLAKKRQIKQGTMQELLTGKRRLPEFVKKPGYKETEVGLIPNDWRVENVDNISVVGRGRVISHREISKSLNPIYPVYSSQTFNNGVMGYIDTFDFDGEYITWTTDGANAGTVFYRNGKFNCTNVCGTIKLKSDDHFFIARVLSRFAYKHVSRHLGNPKIMNDVMKKVKIPISPTKAEQTAIAEILSDMDAQIAALEEKLTKARQVKQGMMQELLTGRIRLVESGELKVDSENSGKPKVQIEKLPMEGEK